MKFEIRHRLRDQELPERRQALLKRIVEVLTSMEHVQGIFLGGSIAKGNEDLYSDIDLRVVVSEERIDDFISDKQEILSNSGSVLFFEDLNPKAPFTIAHFDVFIKVDFFIYTFTQIQPSIWLQDMKILSDPTGKLLEIFNRAVILEYRVTSAEVEAWRGKLFSYIHEVYRRTMREEYYYALTLINNLRSFIVKGWNMEAGRQSNDAWDWSKIEGKRSNLDSWQLSMLCQWECKRDQEEIMKTLNSMIPEIRRVYRSVCENDRNGL